MLVPLACNRLEGFLLAHELPFGLLTKLGRIDTGCELRADLEAAMPCMLQAHDRKCAQRQTLVTAGEGVSDPPPLATLRRDLEVQARAVDESIHLLARLRVDYERLSQRRGRLPEGFG